ncbi:hypothetical protein SOVF_055470, partial [Spinacia oleracea]
QQPSPPAPPAPPSAPPAPPSLLFLLANRRDAHELTSPTPAPSALPFPRGSVTQPRMKYLVMIFGPRFCLG